MQNLMSELRWLKARSRAARGQPWLIIPVSPTLVLLDQPSSGKQPVISYWARAVRFIRVG